MAATVMGRYLRDMASDTAQDHFPGRPIRPLPKRRLRERLSPEVVDTIVYPPSAPAMSPVFFYPYNSAPDDEKSQRQHPTDRARQEEIEHNYISRRNPKEADSDEDYTELAYRSRYSRRHSPYPSRLSPGRSYRYSQKQDTAHDKPAGPASATSSADGYDSFENTNNKKKRKIPTPGDAISNGILLQNDLASLGISSPPQEVVEDDDIEEGRLGEGLYGSVAIRDRVGGDLVGSGRGRLAHSGGGRSPLRSMASASSNAARSSLPRQAPSSKAQPAGIISAAISNAENFTKRHMNGTGGKGNGSLLDAVAAQKPNTTAAQFTFTCDSQVPGSVAWPARPLPSTRSMGQQLSKPVHSEGRPLPGRRTSSSSVVTGPPPRRGSSASRQTPKDNGNGKTAAAPKKRRPTGREYLIAARERKERQQLQNYHHPPALEDQWVCEFCEYERIFGEPPRALIRQYEIKDRAIRKQEAERRRLLEKAKMKGRKSKRGAKPSSNENKTRHAAHCGNQTQSRQGSTHDHGQSADVHEHASDTYSVDGDPGDPEEEFIDDEHPPPLVHRMAPAKPALARSSARPRPGTVQGGTGSSEKFVS